MRTTPYEPRGRSRKQFDTVVAIVGDNVVSGANDSRVRSPSGIDPVEGMVHSTKFSRFTGCAAKAPTLLVLAVVTTTSKCFGRSGWVMYTPQLLANIASALF